MAVTGPKPRRNGGRSIGFVTYDGVAGLDLLGPMDAFTNANRWLEAQRAPAYALTVVSASGGQFSAQGGITMNAQKPFAKAPRFDTIVVPGGAGLRDAKICAPVAAFLKQRAPQTRRVVSICTGAYALGVAGLLDGRRVATHWRFGADIAVRFSKARVDADSIFVRDGSLYSSAGVTAGIDLALALIEEDLGADAALTVAREMVVYMKRSGGQLQFSEPFRFQVGAAGPFEPLAAWIMCNLDGDLSVEALARRAHFCPRHFTRRFSAAFGAPPAEYVERLRLDEARTRLARKGSTIEAISGSVGYKSPDSFRRAFERRFGLSPATYRAHFSERRKTARH